MNKEKTSVIIVDDHALYRLGVRAALGEMQEPIEVLGECGTGRELYAMLEKNMIPHIVLLDVYLPDTTGIEISAYLKQHYPHVKIIVISGEVTPETVDQLLALDVEGYLSKLALMMDLEKAIRSVLAGNHYYGQSVTKILHDVYMNKERANRNKKSIFGKRHDLLTEREVEIVRFICDGHMTKEAPEKLNMSIRTFETHKANILKKLGFNNIAEVIKYAVKHKIVVWV